MEHPNYDKFVETVESFKKDFDKIKDAEMKDLHQIETRCVNELQLIIVEAEMCGRDLKSAVDKRDRELRG